MENGQPRPWSSPWLDWRSNPRYADVLAKRVAMSYLERCAVGLGPATREQIRGYLVRLGEIAAERAEIPAARFIDRRLAELDTRRACEGLEPLLSPAWIETLWELMVSIRDGEPLVNTTARDYANGVLTLLDDMRNHPEAFGWCACVKVFEE